MLTATDLHEPAQDDETRVFLYALTRDPELVAACAAALPGGLAD